MCIMIWDDRSSINLPVLTGGSGLMITHDEETRRYFAGSKVGTAVAYCSLLCRAVQSLWFLQPTATIIGRAWQCLVCCQCKFPPETWSLCHGCSGQLRPLLFQRAGHSQLWAAHRGGVSA